MLKELTSLQNVQCMYNTLKQYNSDDINEHNFTSENVLYNTINTHVQSVGWCISYCVLLAIQEFPSKNMMIKFTTK